MKRYVVKGGSTTLTVNTKKIDDLPAKHKNLLSKVAMSCLRNLVLRTPVDTGRARSNWLASVGSPDEGSVPAGTAGSALRRGAQEFDVDKMPDYPTLFIANNLPYIRRLNEGHSKQAPRDFFLLAIQDSINEFE